MSVNGAIAVCRFGIGARRGEIEAASADPVVWLKDQLRPRTVNFPAGDLTSTKDAIIATQSYNAMRREMKNNASDDAQKKRQAFNRSQRRALFAEITARARFGASTPAPFHERLVRFWSNHFTVSAADKPTIPVAGSFEREAIRPHILGNFTDLALKAILHPAMLIYLDNWQSVGPSARAARRGRRGLNENLAREVMELHTVTPAAGYTQADVTEFAKALTGWTFGNQLVGSDHEIGETIFADVMHKPGARSVMLKTYSQSGSEQAKAIIRDLCSHPKTAQNIAYKLARHFVADEPPHSLVEKLTGVFQSTNGDLKALYEALVDASEAWDVTALKIKTPDELLTSASRLLGLNAVYAGKPKDVFEGFAQRPFSAPSPQGWPDDAASWMGPDALMKRIEWANRVADRLPNADARLLLVDGLGEFVSEHTMTAVSRAESGAQALTLALMSPEFQRR